MYGTFFSVTNSANKGKAIHHDDLVWSYKIGFEALFKNPGLSCTKAPIINDLKTMHFYHFHPCRIKPDDFKQIPPKALLSMLRSSRWIFADWTTYEIYEAVVRSYRYKAKSKKLSQSDTVLLLETLMLASKTYGLYPFVLTPYNEDILTELLYKHQLFLYTKNKIFTEEDVSQSQQNFIKHFNVSSAISHDNRRDLDILSKLLEIVVSRDEKFYLLKALWKTASQSKRREKNGLALLFNEKRKDEDVRELFDPHLMKIVAGYL